LKPLYPILLIAAFTIFLNFNSRSQKAPVKYTEYDHGIYFYWSRENKLDSAFLMFNRYVNNADDTLKKGDAYKYMGEIQWKTGDPYDAQESLFGALNTLDSLNKEHRKVLRIVYNLLGNVYLDLKKYTDAIRFYNSAIDIARGSSYIPEPMNGKAMVLQKIGKYDDAIAVYDSILALKPGDQELVARVIDNGAKTKWLRDTGYLVLPEYRAALQIRVDSQYLAGINASYAHISDYYTKLNPDSALWYAQKMLEMAKENKNPDDMLEAIDKLIRLNNSSVVKGQWYDQFKELSDSIQFSRDTTRNKFALIRYDVQKNKADNLVLQQNVTKQRIWMYGLAAIAIVIIIILSVWYDKRRKRLKQESENAIQDSKFKTSQRVHDVVANGLYILLNKLEHDKEIEREPLTTGIEELYEKSRNISYEDISSDNNADYDTDIHDLLKSFSNDQTKVIITGNQQTFWSMITSFQKHELKTTLKEMMVNMKKHSHAKNVVIAFRQENNKAFINYRDDGLGFPVNLEFGNGLKSTVNRIKSLNGEIIFGKSERGGASILISFPLQTNKT
jgi:tetratricopeptide (TPR) repeat protein